MTVPDAKRIEAERAAAIEALEDAEANLVDDRLKTALSRAYYAAFHAARALLWSKGHVPKRHRGLIRLFGLHIVREQLVSRKVGKTLSDAYEQRELVDYQAMTSDFVREEVEELVRDVRVFVEEVGKLLK